MPEAGPSGKILLVSIPPAVNLLGPLTILVEAIGLLASTPPTPPLILATMSTSQVMEYLMKGVTVAVGKGKLVA